MAVVVAYGADSDLDPSVIPVAEAPLEPIEALRTKNSQKGSRSNGDDEPTDPSQPNQPNQTNQTNQTSNGTTPVGGAAGGQKVPKAEGPSPLASRPA